jgi:YggT family protein
MFARASALLALAALAVVPQLGLVQAMVPLPPAGVAMSLPTCSRREDRRPLVPLGASTGMWTSSSFSSALAFQIPGDSIAETTILGGVLNFLSIYNLIITARVLLSWVPQLQGVALLEPVYVLTDPYLNAFRRLPLQFGGLDFR